MISFKTLLLFISAYGTGAYFVETANTQPFIAPLPGYLIIFIIGFGVTIASLVIDFVNHPRREVFRGVIVLTGYLVIVTIFLHQQIIVRQTSLGIQARNDGVVQTEEAARFLLHGVNPYTADYSNTSFGSFPSLYRPDAPNLAAQHFAYPPLTVLLFVPFIWMKDTLHLMADFQSLYILNLLIFIGLLFAVTSHWSLRTIIVILTLGNPFILASALSGFNDLLVVTGLLGTVLLIARRHWLAAGIVFGLVLATKQTAWLLIPLFAIWAGHLQHRYRSEPVRKRLVYGAGLSMMVILLPFIIWNPSAMYDDLVRYVSGAIPHTMPIAGTTIMQYLSLSGLITDPWSLFPVWTIQLPILIFVWWLASRTLRKHQSESTFLALAGAVILVAILTNRFGGNNYFMIPMALFITAYVYGQQHRPVNDF